MTRHDLERHLRVIAGRAGEGDIEALGLSHLNTFAGQNDLIRRSCGMVSTYVAALEDRIGEHEERLKKLEIDATNPVKEG